MILVQLPIFIDAAIILLVVYCIKKKKLHLLESILIIFVLEMVITSYCAILHINLKLWEVSVEPSLNAVFRIYESIISPVIWLLYFNLLADLEKRMTKFFLVVLVICIQVGVEQWLVVLKVIWYLDWQIWQSILVQILVLTSTSLLHIGYQKILQREGIEVK
ncbi:hypothetical protein BTR25_23535 [Bacillus sp. MRMR6]|nr:hypothetical protein BTR25_23535 [Bacillus sp. MRMR6]